MGIKNLFGLLPKSGKDSSSYVVQFDDAQNGKSAEVKQPAKVETVKTETAKPAKQKKTRAENIGEKKAQTKTRESQKAKVQTAKAEPAKPQPSKPVAAKTAPNTPELPTTFAPTYLNPAASLNGERRRPGANMNSFIDMARQVKKPKVKPRSGSSRKS